MKKRSKFVEVWTGITALFLCHVPLVIAIIFHFWLPLLLGAFVSLAVALIGLTQLMYAIPLRGMFRRRNRPEAARGVVIGIGITVLLNVLLIVGYIVWMMVSVPSS